MVSESEPVVREPRHQTRFCCLTHTEGAEGQTDRGGRGADRAGQRDVSSASAALEDKKTYLVARRDKVREIAACQ